MEPGQSIFYILERLNWKDLVSAKIQLQDTNLQLVAVTNFMDDRADLPERIESTSQIMTEDTIFDHKRRKAKNNLDSRWWCKDSCSSKNCRGSLFFSFYIWRDRIGISHFLKGQWNFASVKGVHELINHTTAKLNNVKSDWFMATTRVCILTELQNQALLVRK